MNEHARELRWIRILLTIIALPVLVLILKTLKAVFIPLVFAIFLSFVFAPLTGFLHRKKVHMALILVTMLIIILLFSIGTFLLLSAATNTLIEGIPRYQQRLMLLTQEGVAWFEGASEKMDIALSNFPRLDITQMLAPGSFSISKTLSDVMSATFDMSWNFFLIVVFLLFLVAQGGLMNQRLKKVMDETHHQRTSDTLQNIQNKIQRYLLTKTLISLSTAAVGMVLMLLFGVEFVLVCGILLFVMNFIPNIGSIIASALPIVICLLQGGFTFRFVAFSLLLIATQMLFGNIIEPKIQGNRLNLSPIMVLISLIFWGWVWGIVGMILAVPVTSAINIMLLQLDDKNLVSAIISGDKTET
jgi:predicted PurR-regulated permease PerM